MNAKYQLSAPFAIAILIVVSLSTGLLLTHAIKSVDFVSAAQGGDLSIQ